MFKAKVEKMMHSAASVVLHEKCSTPRSKYWLQDITIIFCNESSGGKWARFLSGFKACYSALLLVEPRRRLLKMMSLEAVLLARPSIELGTALLDPSDTQGHRDIFEQRGAKERFVGVTTAKKIIAILSGFAPAMRQATRRCDIGIPQRPPSIYLCIEISIQA